MLEIRPILLSSPRSTRVIILFVISIAQESYGVSSVPGEGQLRIFNSINCNVTMDPPIENITQIKAMSDLELLHIRLDKWKSYKTTFRVDKSCVGLALNETIAEIDVTEEKVFIVA